MLYQSNQVTRPLKQDLILIFIVNMPVHLMDAKYLDGNTLLVQTVKKQSISIVLEAES
jgi:hypothetical protein